MAETTVDGARDHAAGKTASMRTIVAASSAGTAFEWYNFFIFGSLAPLIGKLFFANLSPTEGVIFALGVFGAGFLFRPIGALVFGWVGDRMGRKGAFLVTVSLMGLATLAVGFLPTYAQAGILAPSLLLLMRLIQGFALGGEYGGAAVFVAEHSADQKRGEYTGWIQTAASFGLIGALGVIFASTKILGQDAFNAWGWRIPFYFSAVLLAISVFMRMKLSESPAFKRMEAEGGPPPAPFAEAFGRWRYLKVVILALVAIMIAQGVVWYTIYFYVQTFMQQILKVDTVIVTELVLAATVISAPLYVFFAWLSDRIGRKPVMLFGMALAVVTFFPGFHLLTQYANPALAAASQKTPVVVVADPSACSLQFDPVGKTAFTTSCDIVKGALANAGISYATQAAPKGALAYVRVGQTQVASAEAGGLPTAKFKALQGDVAGRVKAALKAAGYPDKADPARVDFGGLLLVMTIFTVAATALYAPIAASLVELFPTRIRYTAMSLPYNIGTGWFGGFVPFVSFSMVVAQGDIYFGLWYPVVATVVSFLVALFFLPETRGRDLYRTD
jgi:MFS family permease